MKLLLIIASVLVCSIRASKDAEDTYLNRRAAFKQLVPSDKCDFVRLIKYFVNVAFRCSSYWFVYTSQVPDAGKVADGPVDGMNNFTRETFYVDTAKGDSFVMFMVDAGDISHKVEVTWKKVAKYFQNNKNALIGQVKTYT